MTASQTFRNTLVVLGTFLVAYALYTSIQILVVLIVALIIASSLRPLVMWFHARNIGIGFSALIVYGLFFIVLIALSVLVIPPITRQLVGYLNTTSTTADTSSSQASPGTAGSNGPVSIPTPDSSTATTTHSNTSLADQLITTQTWLETSLSNVTHSPVKLFDPEQIRTATTNVLTQITTGLPALAGAFGGLFGNFILVVVIGIYWLTSRDQALNFVMQLFGIGKQAMVETISTEIEHSIGNYTRGVIMVATFVGVANFIILRLFNVPSAATLGFIMGVTTILPLVGGYLGAGISTLLALISSPVYALIALGSFIAVQQVENHYLTPRVMSRSVGLNPILIILCLVIGSDLGGVIGALIAVPIAGTIMILLRYLIIEPRKSEALPQYIKGGVLLESPTTTAEKGGTPPPESSTILIAH